MAIKEMKDNEITQVAGGANLKKGKKYAFHNIVCENKLENENEKPKKVTWKDPMWQ